MTTRHIAYAHRNKPKSFELRQLFYFFFSFLFLSFFLFLSRVFTCVHGHQVASTVLLVPKPFRRRRQRWWTAARGQTVPLQWRNQFWQSFEEGAGKRCSECDSDSNSQAGRGLHHPSSKKERCRKARLGRCQCRHGPRCPHNTAPASARRPQAIGQCGRRVQVH